MAVSWTTAGSEARTGELMRGATAKLMLADNKRDAMNFFIFSLKCIVFYKQKNGRLVTVSYYTRLLTWCVRAVG